MKISKNWLRHWISTNIEATELANKLTLAGLEVKGIESTGPELDKKHILIGKILEVVSHPNVDHLKVCKVDIGKKKKLTIVCGAKNAVSGMKVPVALIKAKLTDSEIHGVQSNGILCSSVELGLADQYRDLMELDLSAPIGESFSDYLDLVDQIIEVDLTPNRGDCLGMVGVAREVSALLGSKFESTKFKKIKPVHKDYLRISLQASEACPRYVGRVIKSINMSAHTPDWMAECLRRNEVRNINPIVDVTNYVMLEIGQPMHAFDLSKIQGEIIVRMARNSEKLVLLDGSEVKLTGDDLVIADSKRAIALAGIMGGDNSAISEKTVDIYLEAAFFTPSAIIGKARLFDIHTDASHRFERGVDSELQLDAVERATELILSITGGEPGPISHAVERKWLPKRKPIKFDLNEIERTLGIVIPESFTAKILENLGMCTTKLSASSWKVTPPSWRFDITGQHDLIEEVGRCYGFENIPPKIPKNAARLGRHPESQLSDAQIKHRIVHLGYYEAITYSFVDPGVQKKLTGSSAKNIQLTNPIADNMSVMRESIWPGLLEAVRMNLNHQEDVVRLFEIGYVFLKGAQKRQYKEIKKLAAVVTGPAIPKQWYSEQRTVDFFDIKGDLEEVLTLGINPKELQFSSTIHPALHPGQASEILWKNRRIGYLGKLHPTVQKALYIEQEVYLFEVDLTNFNESIIPVFHNISKFPSVQRDIAVLVNQQVESQKVLELVRITAGNLLTGLELFDIYQGEQVEKNKKSFTFSLTFQSESSNLTSLEVDVIINKIVSVLRTKMQATLRE